MDDGQIRKGVAARAAVLVGLSGFLWFGCKGADRDPKLAAPSPGDPYFGRFNRGPEPSFSASEVSVQGIQEFDERGSVTRLVRQNVESTFIYDANGRLVQQNSRVVGNSAVLTAIAIYDADGYKLGSYSAGAMYTFVNEQIRTVSRDGGAPVGLLRYEDSELDEQGALAMFATDHLGSVVGAADAASGWRQVKDTLPYGQTLFEHRAVTPTLVTDYGFNGKRIEGFAAMASSFLDFHARSLASNEGIFLQTDTVIPDSSSALGYNRYAYAYNNPVNLIDPDGHRPEQDLFTDQSQSIRAGWEQFKQQAANTAQGMARAALPLTAHLWSKYGQPAQRAVQHAIMTATGVKITSASTTIAEWKPKADGAKGFKGEVSVEQKVGEGSPFTISAEAKVPPMPGKGIAQQEVKMGGGLVSVTTTPPRMVVEVEADPFTQDVDVTTAFKAGVSVRVGSEQNNVSASRSFNLTTGTQSTSVGYDVMVPTPWGRVPHNGSYGVEFYPDSLWFNQWQPGDQDQGSNAWDAFWYQVGERFLPIWRGF